MNDLIINLSDSTIRSVMNTAVVKYGKKIYSQFPSAIISLPTINLVAISILGDTAEFFINRCFQHYTVDSTNHYENIASKYYLLNTLVNITARTVIGAGVLAFGALATGSSILPAITLGVATGALVFLINKVSKYSLFAFKVIGIICLGIATAAAKKIQIFKDLESLFVSIMDIVKYSIPKQTISELNGISVACTDTVIWPH